MRQLEQGVDHDVASPRRGALIQDGPVADDQGNCSHWQNLRARTQAAMSFHGLDRLGPNGSLSGTAGAFARTNCKPRNPTAPLPTLFKPASLSNSIMSGSLR